MYEGVSIIFNEMYIFCYIVSFTLDTSVVDTMRIIVRDHPLCKPLFSATALPCDYVNVLHVPAENQTADGRINSGTLKQLRKSDVYWNLEHEGSTTV